MIVIVTAILTLAFSICFFFRTRIGLAMQAASQNQWRPIHWDPRQAYHSLGLGIVGHGSLCGSRAFCFASKGPPMVIRLTADCWASKPFAAAAIGGFRLDFPVRCWGVDSFGWLNLCFALWDLPVVSQIAPMQLAAHPDFRSWAHISPRTMRKEGCKHALCFQNLLYDADVSLFNIARRRCWYGCCSCWCLARRVFCLAIAMPNLAGVRITGIFDTGRLQVWG